MMAKKRKAETSDRRHLLTVGLPVALVLATLVLGALLQSGRGSTSDSAVLDEEAPLPPPPSYEQRWSDSALDENPLEVDPREMPEDQPPAATAPAPTRPPQPAEGVSRLARKVMRDVERLQATGDPWTAQIGVYCDDQRVDQLARRFADEDRFYLLPVLLEERACFRICWGHFTDRDRASQVAGSLPAPFRGEKPIPRRVAAVLE
jgi:septal ring-binding cell division protein DamX